MSPTSHDEISARTQSGDEDQSRDAGPLHSNVTVQHDDGTLRTDVEFRRVRSAETHTQPDVPETVNPIQDASRYTDGNQWIVYEKNSDHTANGKEYQTMAKDNGNQTMG